MDYDNERLSLSIDLETYSSQDIKAVGAQRYMASDDFEILLFAYAWNDSGVQVIDLARGETIPRGLIEALKDPHVIKRAYNAAFEYNALSWFYGPLDASQWRDTMLHAMYCGYPASLAAAGAALGLPEDKQKLKIGSALIRYFCVPCNPTKSNGGRTRNLPEHDPEKWAMFKGYNQQDVVTERTIAQRLASRPVPDAVQKQWETNLRINCRGVYADLPMVDGALAIGAQVTAELTTQARIITGLENPNSIQQLQGWLKAQGLEVDDVRKDTVAKLAQDETQKPIVREMLGIRQALGKSSIKKYDAIRACVCPDGRIRGLLQFYGANRTGRWAGRLVQVQNLPRTYTQNIPFAKELIREQKKGALQLCYGNVSDTLSQLIRTALIATPGNVLIDADFSAIEARVISWLAGESWRLDVFRSHGKIYEASASQMFGVPIEKIKKGNPEYALRAKGKVAELALGYQGGAGALINMGALDMGLTEEELPDIVTRWRKANHNIQQLWYDMNAAAIQVISSGGSVRVRCLTLAREYDVATGDVTFSIRLPSGRKLYYVDPLLGENRFGSESITYMGISDQKKWARLETYGGKLVENCVQAIARDCLAEAIERLEAAGYPIVFHVHDEVVIDIARYADDEKMLDDVVELMKKPPAWASDLPLNADGWVGTFFTKD